MNPSVEILKQGGVVILLTDTLYAVAASALIPHAVERVYALRGRDSNKPCIILISSLKDLEIFGISLSKKEKDILRQIWPNTISIILPSYDAHFSYLDRGSGSLCFRMPADQTIQKILSRSGPLIAPSANLQGKKPALTIAEARAYFGDKVDFYVDSGKRSSFSSTILRLKNEGFELVREGAYSVAALKKEGFL